MTTKEEKKITKASFKKVHMEEKKISANYERGLWKDVFLSLKENKLAMICAVILLIVILMAVFAPLCPYDPDKQDLMNKLLQPGKDHWFGTDELGRDYFTRTLYGGRISLSVGFLSMIMSTTIGTIIGTVSGYVGGCISDAFYRCVYVCAEFSSDGCDQCTVSTEGMVHDHYSGII